MSGNLYLPAKDVIALTGLKKSQVYKLIKQKAIRAESEVVGADSRHKILVSSILVWLAAKNKFHRDEADKLERSYKILKRSVDNG
jgi:hypothetical protein